MVTKIREVLTVADMKLAIFCGGQSYVGIRLAGTWVGTVTFEASNDGVNFSPVTVTPFASGTAVQTATGNGNWFIAVGSYVAFRANLTAYTSGSVEVNLAASLDASYQDAYLTPTSIWVNSRAVGGVNTLTKAAQANRSWTLKTLKITVDRTPGWVTSPHVQLLDGVGGTVLWGIDLPTVGSSGQLYDIALPSGGIFCTPGNAFVIVLASPGASPISNINAEFSAG